jgi:hypothetical protein
MTVSAGAPVRREVRRPGISIRKGSEARFVAGAPHKGVFLRCLSRMKGYFQVRV